MANLEENERKMQMKEETYKIGQDLEQFLPILLKVDPALKLSYFSPEANSLFNKSTNQLVLNSNTWKNKFPNVFIQNLLLFQKGNTISQHFFEIELENNQFYLVKFKKELDDSANEFIYLSFTEINQNSLDKVENSQTSSGFNRTLQDASQLNENLIHLFHSQKHFENSIDGILILDSKTFDSIECNNRALEIFGFNKKEFLKLKAIDFSPKLQNGGISSIEKAKIIKKQLIENGYLDYDWIHLTKMGKPVYTRITAFYNFFNNHQCLMVRIRDISEKINAIKEVETHHERFELALQTGNLGTWDWNLETGYTHYSKRWAEMLGYTLSEIEPTADTFNSIVHPDDIKDVISAISNHIKGKTPFFELEIRMKHKSGVYKWIYDRGKVVEYTKEGKPLRCIGIFQDIHDKKLLETELLEREKVLISAQKLAKIGDWQFDVASQKIRWSEETFRIFELDPKLGPPTFQEYPKYIHPEDQQILFDSIQKAISDGIPYQLEIRNILPNGSEKKTFACAQPLFEKGKVVRLFGTVQDISYLHLIRQDLEFTRVQLSNKIAELELKNRELEKYIDSNLELENFAYVASHDLREPLRSIISFTQLLENKAGKEFKKEHLEYMDFIVSAAKEMDILIEDLLLFSRVNTENQDFKFVNTSNFINNILLKLEKSILDSQCQIQLNNLPENIFIQTTKMGQVFQNLISNAIKFKHPNRSLEINISSRELESVYEFSISDNGIGIEKEYFEKIFLLFKRLHTKTKFRGTGIGLAICKKVIENQGGKIWLESEVNKGSTFKFTIVKKAN